MWDEQSGCCGRIGLLARSFSTFLLTPTATHFFSAPIRSTVGALRQPHGVMLSPRLAVQHPQSSTPAKAAYLSFKLSGFLAQPYSHSNSHTGGTSGSSSSKPSSGSTNAASKATPASATSAASGAAAASPPANSSSSTTTAFQQQLQRIGIAGAAAGGNGSSSSPWRLGLWTPSWNHVEGLTAAAAEGLSAAAESLSAAAEGLSAAAAAAAAGLGEVGSWTVGPYGPSVTKYPGYVEVTLSAVPRPSGAVVVTVPAAGIRPALPAGYGSGFEIGG